MRCLAVEPGETQMDDEKGVILIPNQSEKQVAFYLATIANDVACALLRHLASKVCHVPCGFSTADSQLQHLTLMVERDEKKPSALLPFERAQYGSDEAKFGSVMRKRSSGRLNKLLGDLCLLAASAADALPL